MAKYWLTPRNGLTLAQGAAMEALVAHFCPVSVKTDLEPLFNDQNEYDSAIITTHYELTCDKKISPFSRLVYINFKKDYRESKVFIYTNKYGYDYLQTAAPHLIESFNRFDNSGYAIEAQEKVNNERSTTLREQRAEV